jgi:hypothetical protein
VALHHAPEVRKWLGTPTSTDATDIACQLGALNPALQVAIFEGLLKQASWSELVQWSSEPPLLTVFGFGMHRGQRFDQAPRDYLEWIADGQNDLREDVKFSARYWLSRTTNSD